MYNRRPLTVGRAFPVLETERANADSIRCGHTKFVGDWHVLANIPTFPERGAIKVDYLWIMSRDLNLSRETLDVLIDMAVRQGYDRELIQFPERRESFLTTG
jgi:lipocalin